jgi:hypothetical protein
MPLFGIAKTKNGVWYYNHRSSLRSSLKKEPLALREVLFYSMRSLRLINGLGTGGRSSKDLGRGGEMLLKLSPL